jgi:hypothetical protein
MSAVPRLPPPILPPVVLRAITRTLAFAVVGVGLKRGEGGVEVAGHWVGGLGEADRAGCAAVALPIDRTHGPTLRSPKVLVAANR